MKNMLVVGVMLAVGAASVSADVTVVQRITMEGQAAAMMQGTSLPTMTMRIKGRKSRSEIEMNGQTMSTIADLDSGQIIVLDAARKTATVTTAASMAAAMKDAPMPSIDMSMNATGKSQTINGQVCDEQTFSMAVGLGEMAGQMQMSPEAAETLKDVKIRMNGSFWVAKTAPGAAEFIAFTRVAVDSKLLAAMLGGIPGMDRMMEAASSLTGLPYLTRMTMTFEGSHPMVEMMKQMGGFTVEQRVQSVSTDPLPDDLFRIPEGYTIEKK
jgi:hypothetical protein